MAPSQGSSDHLGTMQELCGISSCHDSFLSRTLREKPFHVSSAHGVGSSLSMMVSLNERQDVCAHPMIHHVNCQRPIDSLSFVAGVCEPVAEHLKSHVSEHRDHPVLMYLGLYFCFKDSGKCANIRNRVLSMSLILRNGLIMEARYLMFLYFRVILRAICDVNLILMLL
jgi:hypothetical protein